MTSGPDVDVVVDVHQLPVEWSGHFDAFVASAVWEHLARPWVAAYEVARILAPGGICYIDTTQTFPLHAYPADYFRFSREALSLLFTDAGLEVVTTRYRWRAKITASPEVLPDPEWWNAEFPSWLVVALIGRKPVQ